MAPYSPLPVFSIDNYLHDSYILVNFLPLSAIYLIYSDLTNPDDPRAKVLVKVLLLPYVEGGTRKVDKDIII